MKGFYPFVTTAGLVAVIALLMHGPVDGGQICAAAEDYVPWETVGTNFCLSLPTVDVMPHLRGNCVQLAQSVPAALRDNCPRSWH
jgi:hypothetical protein